MAFGIQNAWPGVKVAAALASILLCAGPADAAWLRRDGDTLRLRGMIEMGDAERFLALLRERPGARILTLNSPGGSVRGAIALGEAVRRARLATVVDAAGEVCDSACTMIFAAGTTRHYLNAASLPDGYNGQSGLGYHRSYDRGTRVSPPMVSAEGERMMHAYYRRMGASAASALAVKGTIQTFWRPGAATALRLRLATCLAPPSSGPARLSPPSSRRISGSPAPAQASSPTSRGN